MSISAKDDELVSAVWAGDIEKAKVAIGNGADLEVKFGNNADTPLHIAAERGLHEIAGLLIDSGADINSRDYCGGTPLHQAAWSYADNTRLETVNLLIGRGAEVDARDIYENTPLKLAASKGRNDVVKVLIDAGADVNAQGYNGDSPLHEAASSWNGHDDVVRTLLDNGADIYQENCNGLTSLGAAEEDTRSHQVLKAEHSKRQLLDGLDKPFVPSAQQEERQQVRRRM